jgi:hypothetical protein
VITADDIRATPSSATVYTAVIVRPGAHFHDEGAQLREHARRDMQLRADGLLNVVCPIGDTQTSGIGIFDAELDDVSAVVELYPAVPAGVLGCEAYPCRCFPGDQLRG